MPPSQAYGGLLARIAANEMNGYPYFHEDPEKACAEPGACHVRGWCWTFWRGRSPLSRRQSVRRVRELVQAGVLRRVDDAS